MVLQWCTKEHMKTEALSEEIKIRVPKDIKRDLQTLADARHVKPAAVAREAIREHIAKNAKLLKAAA